MNELVRQYRIFCQVVPLRLPNDHDFGHFMAWLENQISISGTSTTLHQQVSAHEAAQLAQVRPTQYSYIRSRNGS